MKPGPFIYGVQGETVADLRIDLNTGVENRENALFIVRACNAHEELLAALRGLVCELESVHVPAPGLQHARKAIAKAEGKES